MPDPVLFVKAVVAAAVASAVWVLAAGWLRRNAKLDSFGWASSSALGVGTYIGFYVLAITPGWSLASVIDRFLIVLFPAAIVVELLSSIPRMPRWAIWLMRLVLAAAAGRILLHGSSYLTGEAAGSTISQVVWELAVAAGILIAVWRLLLWLLRRNPSVSIPLALAETCLGSGLAVMLSAYLTGGEVGLSLAAALVGVAGTAWLLAKTPAVDGAIGIAPVGLFGVVMMGRFFGDLSTGRCLTLLLSPLLCLVSELPMLRSRRPWVIGMTQLAAVAIPLAIVLILAKHDFDRAMENSY